MKKECYITGFKYGNTTQDPYLHHETTIRVLPIKTICHGYRPISSVSPFTTFLLIKNTEKKNTLANSIFFSDEVCDLSSQITCDFHWSTVSSFINKDLTLGINRCLRGPKPINVPLRVETVTQQMQSNTELTGYAFQSNKQ